MIFLQPAFLFALFSLAIPIIIHLFNFRKFKTVYFTNVKFLREVKQESQSRNKLRHLLILLARCLALASLVFAFAQPIIPLKENAAVGEKAISIYVDNSFSMDALAESGSLFEQAKKAASEIALAYNATDKFQLITNDMEGRHQRWVNREQFIASLDEVKISPNSTKLSQIQKKQLDLFNKSDANNKYVYVISDLQKSNADIDELLVDSLIEMNFVNIKSQTVNNLFIDSCWFEKPYRNINQPDELFFAVKNYSTQRVDNVSVSMDLNDIAKGLQNLSIGADSVSNASISFLIDKPDIYAGSLKLNDHPITYDNELFFAFPVREAIHILLIAENEQQKYVNRLFANNAGFKLENMQPGQVEYSRFANQQLIILNQIDNISSGFQQELIKYVNEGGSLLFFPSLNGNIEGYNTLFSAFNAGAYAAQKAGVSKVEKINIQNKIYDDVFEKIPENIDLPIVNQHLQFASFSRSRMENVMTLANGFPFIAQFQAGNGKLYIGAVPLDEQITNFPKHALFIPTLYKIALYSVPPARLYYTIGTNEAIVIPEYQKNNEQALKLSNASDQFEIIPEYRFMDGKAYLYVYNQIEKAGIYNLKAGNEVISRIAFNYNRNESDLAHYKEDELEKMLQDKGFVNLNLLQAGTAELTLVVKQLDEGRRLWKIFVILALIFLLSEILLIRFLK